MRIEASHIRTVGQMPDDQLDKLRQSWEAHPYSSTLAVLLTKGYESKGDIRYEEMLRMAALLSNNRKQLHSALFDAVGEPSDINSEETAPTDQGQITDNTNLLTLKEEEKSKQEEKQKASSEVDNAEIDAFERQYLAEALGAGLAIDLITNDAETKAVDSGDEKIEVKEVPVIEEGKQEAVEPNKQSFADWLNYLSGGEAAVSSARPPLIMEEEHALVKAKNFKEVASIVDHFIEKEDAIVPKRASFFSPAKAAKASITDREDIVTETLAKVYAAQGNVNKAISTYEKLSLLYPEKSSYFAALISSLKTDK